MNTIVKQPRLLELNIALHLFTDTIISISKPTHLPEWMIMYCSWEEACFTSKLQAKQNVGASNCLLSASNVEHYRAMRCIKLIRQVAEASFSKNNIMRYRVLLYKTSASGPYWNHTVNVLGQTVAYFTNKLACEPQAN